MKIIQGMCFYSCKWSEIFQSMLSPRRLGLFAAFSTVLGLVQTETQLFLFVLSKNSH